MNGFLCSLGSYIAGNTSQLQSAYSEALLAEALSIILGVAGVVVISYEIYNTAKAGGDTKGDY